MGTDNCKIVADNGIQNLMKSQILQVEFKKEAYYEGQLVEGTIILEPRQNLVFNDIMIRFRQSEYFIYVQDEKTTISDVAGQTFFEKRLNAGEYLNMNSQMLSLNPGNYKFPFQFTLPKNIPPSFEFPFHNRRASIRYMFTAEVLSPYNKETCDNYLFIKSRPINIPSDVRHENFVNVRNMGIVSRGRSGIALFTLSNNFRMNDMIPFTVDIMNEECGVPVKEIKVSIKRIVTFVKQGKEYPKRTAILRKRYPAVCDKNCKQSYHYEDIQLRDNDMKDVEFNKHLNPYPNIDDLNLLMPNVRSNLIKCEYSLKVTSYFDMSVLEKNRPRVEMPIYVTHQLQKEYDYEKDTNQYNGQGQQFGNNSQFGGGFGNNNYGNNNNFGNNNYGNNNNFGNNNLSNNNNNFGYNNNYGSNNNNQGGYGQNKTNNASQKSNDLGSSQFSYEAYIAKKKLSSSAAPDANKNNNNNNNFGNFGSSNNNNFGNYGSGNNNNFGSYGNNNNNNFGSYGNNNNNNFGSYGNSNNNNFGSYGNSSSNNNFGSYGNSSSNNNFGSYGNSNNNYGSSSNYNPGSYGGGLGSGTANPYGGGSNDFPSADKVNSNPNQAENPFGDSGGYGNNNNNPSNPFGGSGGSGPYGGSYPSF